MTTESQRRLARGVALLLLTLAASAHADHGEIPLDISQSLRFKLTAAEEVRLSYSFLVGVLAAVSYREQADLDHSGTLDAAEQRALGQRLAAEVAQRLDLSLDGERAALRFEEPRTAFESDRVGPWPFSVHLTTVLRAQAREVHELRLRGVVPLPPLGEAQIAVSAVAPVRLLGVTHAERTADGARTSYFKTDGSAQPLAFTFTGSRRPRVAPARVLVRAAMALGVGLIALGLVLLRRRPRPLQERNLDVG